MKYSHVSELIILWKIKELNISLYELCVQKIAFKFKTLPNSPVCLTTKQDKGWGINFVLFAFIISWILEEQQKFESQKQFSFAVKRMYLS